MFPATDATDYVVNPFAHSNNLLTKHCIHIVLSVRVTVLSSSIPMCRPHSVQIGRITFITHRLISVSDYLKRNYLPKRPHEYMPAARTAPTRQGHHIAAGQQSPSTKIWVRIDLPLRIEKYLPQCIHCSRYLLFIMGYTVRHLMQ